MVGRLGDAGEMEKEEEAKVALLPSFCNYFLKDVDKTHHVSGPAGLNGSTARIYGLFVNSPQNAGFFAKWPLHMQT